MRFGFIGPSYTARSSAVADEECINFFAESVESQGGFLIQQPYGERSYGGLKSYFGTPGIAQFANLNQQGVRGQLWTGSRLFAVAGTEFVEVMSNGTVTNRATVAADNNPASLAWNGIQVLVISAGHAYCFTLATNAWVEVTASLAGVPLKADYSDSYFVVCFQNSNKFQMSQVLDGTTWPGQLVNEISVFPENISSIIVNHRELWVFGQQHTQPYQDTGSAEVFDPIPGTLIEKGCVATFSPCRLDNSIFWIDQDERGAASAWRSSGYTPQRISTHAVEIDLAATANLSGCCSYAYQDGGHLFWVLYIPGASWTWVYDVGEQLWHKRAHWNNAQWQAALGWNHAYAFGQHLIGVPGNVTFPGAQYLYTLSMANYSDSGSPIRRLRRSPAITDEMKWITHAELTVDFDTGQGPQPPLTDGAGNPRPPQAMLRWSDDRGKTWSNEHIADCGFAGEYKARAVWRRLGRSRYRVYELSVSDPIPWAIVDAYLRTA